MSENIVAITIFIGYAQSLQAALEGPPEDEPSASKKRNDCQIENTCISTIHLDREVQLRDVKNVCSKSTQKSYQGPPRRSKGIPYHI